MNKFEQVHVVGGKGGAKLYTFEQMHVLGGGDSQSVSGRVDKETP